MSSPVPAPLDVFNTHKATLVSELEHPVEFVADYCRDADIIDLQFHEELVLVSDKKHKAQKLVNAVCDRIEAQPAQVEEKECVLRRFIGVLRRESSCELEQVAIKLEKSLSQEFIAVCTEESSPPKDPLSDYITKKHRREIGKHMSFWNKWANALNLTAAQISGIREDNSLDYNMKGEKVLELWANEYNATYRVLCKVGLEIGQREVAFKVCKMVDGDWSSICPTDDTSDGDRLPVQSTGVDTTPSQLTIDARGREIQVVSGLRQRGTDIPDELLVDNVIGQLYTIKARSYSNQSTISQLKNERSDLQTKLQIVTNDLEVAKERINEKEKELRQLRFQNHMQSISSQVEGMESRVEDLKATSEQTKEELREKISKCEQEKLSLMGELKIHEIKEEYLKNQIKELNKMLSDKKGWFSYVMPGKINSAMCTFFATGVCIIVCVGVFLVVLLIVFVARFMRP